MKLLSLFHKSPEQPLPVVPLPPASLSLQFAYGCDDCGRIYEGVCLSACRGCGKTNIFHVRSLRAHVLNKEAQHRKLQEKMTAAFARKERNNLALLTAFQDPPPEAA